MKACDYEIIEERFEINVNVFGYENKVFRLYVSKKKIKIIIIIVMSKF